MAFFRISTGDSIISSSCEMKYDEAQSGIKISGRNTNNLRYADDRGDTTLVAESKEELKNLLIRVKEESEKVDLKLSIRKTKIMAFPSHHFMANRRGKRGGSDIIFLGSKTTVDSKCRQEIKGLLLFGRKTMTSLNGILKAEISLC